MAVADMVFFFGNLFNFSIDIAVQISFEVLLIAVVGGKPLAT